MTREGAKRTLASVRFRVTATATLALLAVLVVTGITLVIAQRELLIGDLDDTLRQRADDVIATTRGADPPAVLPAVGDEDSAAQVVDSAGRVVAATANIAGAPPVAPVPDAHDSESFASTDHLPIAGEFRVLSRRIDNGAVHVTAGLDDIDESADVLRLLLWIAIPTVTALLAALVWWLVGRTLRPVEAIRAEVAGFGPADLGRRVPEPGTGDEIDRLAQTMNASLDRIENAVRRQQQFVADASHELRSPLTRIRSEVEVDLEHPARADLVATQRSVLEETVGLQRLVDDLLILARADGATAPLRDEPIDLDDVVLEHAARLRAIGSLTIDSAAVTGAQVRGDRAQLDRAVANVVDNAARYATTGIVFALGESGDAAVLTVTDDGPGVPPEQRELIFERFARIDDARARSTGGAGLGLAIAREIVERHRGSISVDPDYRDGARFVVRLPRA